MLTRGFRVGSLLPACRLFLLISPAPVHSIRWPFPPAPDGCMPTRGFRVGSLLPACRLFLLLSPAPVHSTLLLFRPAPDFCMHCRGFRVGFLLLFDPLSSLICPVLFHGIRLLFHMNLFENTKSRANSAGNRLFHQLQTALRAVFLLTLYCV